MDWLAHHNHLPKQTVGHLDSFTKKLTRLRLPSNLGGIAQDYGIGATLAAVRHDRIVAVSLRSSIRADVIRSCFRCCASASRLISSLAIQILANNFLQDAAPQQSPSPACDPLPSSALSTIRLASHHFRQLASPRIPHNTLPLCIDPLRPSPPSPVANRSPLHNLPTILEQFLINLATCPVLSSCKRSVGPNRTPRLSRRLRRYR